MKIIQVAVSSITGQNGESTNEAIVALASDGTLYYGNWINGMMEWKRLPDPCATVRHDIKDKDYAHEDSLRGDRR